MSPITLVYIVTVVISIIVALLLIYSSDLSTRAKIRAEKKGLRGMHLEAGFSQDSALKQALSDEIGNLLDRGDRGKGVIEAAANVFTKELEKRIDLKSRQISEKYEKVILEKSTNETMAWNKYDKVLSAKKETEAIIRSIAEGLVVVDASGKVIMMNPAAEKLLGVSRKDKIGTSILDGAKDEQLFSLARESFHGGKKEVELTSQHDETKKVVRASTAVIEDECGQTVGMVSVLNDITKQRELDDLKASFVAKVSHELRTPLVTIEKAVGMILDGTKGEVPKGQSDLLAIAHRNLKRLSLLINDLLDLSKLEASKVELNLKPSSIGDIIVEAAESLSAWAGAKSIEIKKDIQKDLPQFNVDPEKIIQVLNNLIGNSIKFTPNGGTVTIRALFKDGIEVSVQDTGIGIAKKELTKVFDKFYQTGDRTATDIPGTGIGLAIAKEIVELHGGKIWAESESGQGSSFIFFLPNKA